MNWTCSDLLFPFMSLGTAEFISDELVRSSKPHRMADSQAFVILAAHLML